MIDTAMQLDRTATIVVGDVFPHSAQAIWRALTTGELMGRWLMEPSGFEPVVGNRFSYRTRAAGPWDGVIQCEVTEVVEHERLAYSWRGGHANNQGYGSPLDTVVTFSLSPEAGGTRLQVAHSGFVLPRNDSAYQTMSNGWKGVVHKIGEIAGALQRH